MHRCVAGPLIGALQPLDHSDVLSGIAKSPVASALMLTRLGLEGDQQGDLRRHGGVEKAVHYYPHEHYDWWRNHIGPDPLLGPGAFGENFCGLGLTEANVAIGDIFQLGGARVQVSMGRQPCWRLNRRFGRADIAMRMQTSGRTGWYFRVLEDGFVPPNADLLLVDRPAPEWGLRRVHSILYLDTMNREGLREMADLEHLGLSWRQLACRRLETGRVEDWSPRLEGASAADNPMA